MSDQTPSNHDFDPTDPLVSAWAIQDGVDRLPGLPTDTTALVDGMEAAHRKDQRRLVWLNVRETLPSFAIAGFFAAGVSSAERPVALLAGVSLIFAVGCFLAITSFRQYKADRCWGASVYDQLAQRLAQLNHGAWLLRNVGWWYFLPFGLAIVLVSYGFGADFGSTDGLILLGVAFVSIAVMYPINRRIGRTRYEAEIERLEPILAEFDRTE